MNEFLLLCQWLPDDRYALFPIDHPSPPAFQKMYLSLVTCLNTGRSGAQSTWSSVYLYRPSQLAYVAPNTFNVSQITFGPGWIWFPKKKGFDGLGHDYLMIHNFINGLSIDFEDNKKFDFLQFSKFRFFRNWSFNQNMKSQRWKNQV